MLKTLTEVNPTAIEEIKQEKALRKTHEVFLLFSMGSQFDHLIKQKLDQLGVFCLVADPKKIIAADVKKINPVGIILSGGPASVHAEPPPFDGAIFDLDIPTLGICLGFQMWAAHIGVAVVGSDKREFGTHDFKISDSSAPLFSGIPKLSKVMESHGDKILADPKMQILGITDNAPASAGNYKHLWGVQFHPEVTETEFGTKIYENFCFGICGARDKYPASEVAGAKIEELAKQISGKKVLIALSGGSDSSVVAYLLRSALTKVSSVGAELARPQSANNNRAAKASPYTNSQLLGIYIKGIDRPDDEAHVLEYFAKENWLTVKIVDATEEFLKALKGKTSMADKRIAIRGIYKDVLEKEITNFGADFIAQGTLYTDISESGGGYSSGARKAQIKLHHNINLNFSVAELSPLADCVKDSARNIGRSIGVPEALLLRHPFPGPGLAVRIEGEVTAEKLHTARKIDGIYIEELRKWKLYDSVWQAGAVVTSSITTCTKGDDAAEGHVVALWAVWSVNGFTARAAELPYDFLKFVARRMTNEIREVGNVVYRVSDKPPTTIEWG